MNYGAKSGKILSDKINQGLNNGENQKTISWILLATTFKDLSMKQIFQLG